MNDFYRKHSIIRSIRTRNLFVSYVQHFRNRVGKKKQHRAGPAVVRQQQQRQQQRRLQRRQQQHSRSRRHSRKRSRSSRRCGKHNQTSAYTAAVRILHSSNYFGIIFEDEKTAPSSSDLRDSDYPTHVQQSYSFQVPQLRHLPQTLPVPPSVEGV